MTPWKPCPDGLTAQNLQYVYDGAGNRISESVNGVSTTYTVNNVNQYTSSTIAGLGTTTYQYDADGNLVATNALGGGTTSYAFNDLSQLTAVNGPGLSASYFYDPLGSLVSQTVNSARTNFQIDPTGLGNLVASFSGTGVYNNGGGLFAHYTYGLGLTSQVSPAGAPFYYDFSLTGNTIGMTNTGGSAYVNRYSYVPFGDTTGTGTLSTNPFTLVGEFGVVAQGSGLYAMRARFYSSIVGSFFSRDPHGLAGSGTNLYRYVDNQPINFVDPAGTYPQNETGCTMTGDFDTCPPGPGIADPGVHLGVGVSVVGIIMNPIVAAALGVATSIATGLAGGYDQPGGQWRWEQR